MSYYTADPKHKCVNCGRPAARNRQLIRTHAGYKCGGGCQPHGHHQGQEAGPTPTQDKADNKAKRRKTRVGW